MEAVVNFKCKPSELDILRQALSEFVDRWEHRSKDKNIGPKERQTAAALTMRAVGVLEALR
jgi:hypothetical protein